jgi:sulfur carrier protein ThiS adenylyltransferase
MGIQEIRSILKNKTVGIAGAGGLGSNCAITLARTGVGRLITVDFDDISFEQIDRQYYFFNQLGKKKVLALKDILKEVAPTVTIVPLAVKIQQHHVVPIFKSCDLIIEALDDPATKKMFVEEVSRELPDIPIVAATRINCRLPASSMTVKQSGQVYLCGYFSEFDLNDHPPLAPKVAMLANLQADIAVNLLLGLPLVLSKEEDLHLFAD